jgi:hypothetical protein
MVIATATEFYRVSPEKAFTGPFPNQADIMDIITADFDPEQVPKQSPKLIRMKPIKNPDSPTTLTVYRGELKGAPERKPEGGDTFIDTWVKDRKIDNRYEIDKARDTMRQLLAITKKPFPETLPLEALALAEKLGEKLSSASVQKRMSYLCAAFKAGLKYHLTRSAPRIRSRGSATPTATTHSSGNPCPKTTWRSHVRHNQEVDRDRKELSVTEHRPLLLSVRISKVGLHGAGEPQVVVREVQATCDGTDHRHNDVLDQRRNDSSERRADDDAYREVNDVASHCKLFELLKHGLPPSVGEGR